MSETEVVTPEQMTEQLRAMRAHVPDYGQVSAGKKRPLSRTAQASPALIAAANNAVAEVPRVAEILGRTAQEQQQDAIDAQRWDAFETEVDAFKHGLSASTLIRRHRIGLTALQIYSICKQLLRQESNVPLLAVHVQKMKALKKFAAIRQKVRPAPAEPEPSPDVPTLPPV